MGDTRARKPTPKEIEDDRGLMRNYMNTALEHWASFEVCDQVFKEFYGESRKQKTKRDLAEIMKK